MQDYAALQSRLRQDPKTWLITGVAGFIGSNLLEALLRLDPRRRPRKLRRGPPAPQRDGRFVEASSRLLTA